MLETVSKTESQHLVNHALAFDYIFKRIMHDMFPSCEAKPEDVGILPLKIDVVVRCRDDVVPTAPMLPLFAARLARENLFEYKSAHDKRRVGNLAKLLGYVGLYCDHHEIEMNEIQDRIAAWYITAIRPSFLEGLVANGMVTPENTAGLYSVTRIFPCHCWIVVCDELDLIAGNIPLLTFGSTSSIKNAVRLLARSNLATRHGMETIINMIYLFYHNEVIFMTEMKELVPGDVWKNLAHAAEDLGIDKVINEIGIDKVIAAVGIDKVIAAVGIDNVEAALAKAKANQKPKKKK